MGKTMLLAVILALVLPMAALAQEYKTGERIEVLITNATSGKIVTGATCKISVYNATVIAVTNASMTDAADGNYYWAVAGLATQPTAPYKARVVCAIGGADWVTESLFGVVTTSYASWLSGIDSAIDGLPTSCGSGSSNLTVCGQGASNLTDAAVWAYASRTLTQNITQNLTAADVWTYADRQLTAFSFSVNVTQAVLDNIATGVWASGTRTLTSFGSLVADTATAVWAAVARTLTDFDDVWTVATRTLTQNITQNVSTGATNYYNITNNTAVNTNNYNITNNTAINYNTDNSTFNIILPISE